MPRLPLIAFFFPRLICRSQHKIFKRKGQLRLSEVWVTKCMDKSLESILVPDTYFVLGWPFTNCVAAFSTPEEKELWFNLLWKYVCVCNVCALYDVVCTCILAQVHVNM